MSALARGTIIAGRYRLEKELARGGMGSVWVARHLQLEVDVAIKFMSAQFASSAEARGRFEREARASAQLKLANAVQVHDYGVAAEIGEGAPFLVMELLDGEDLHTRLQHEGRLTPFATLAILGPVCRAVQRAHELGLVHRDLKPANIFLARQGSEEVVKVLDFGIAKDTTSAFGGGSTRTGAMLGSPNYMSPEQIRSSNRVDHRSDLWSIGVIAFECLTGRRSFHSDEVGEVLVDVCTAPIPVPSQLAPDLGPEVDRFFARALVRDPAQRFQSARELLDAFTAVAAPATMDPMPLPAPSVSMGPQAAPNPAHPPLARVAPPQSVSTFSPSEQTQQHAASRRVGIGLVSLAAAAALLLAAVVAHRALSAEHVDVSAHSAALPSAAEPAPVTTSAPTPAAPSPAQPSASAPQPSASASAAPSGRPSSKAPPVRHKEPTRKDDLLNHL